MDSPKAPIEPRTAGSRAAQWMLGCYVVIVLALTLAGAALVRSAGDADAPVGGVLLLGAVVL